MASGVCLDSYEAHEGEINAVAFSPDGKTLATASNDSTTRLWNKETGLSVATLEGHSEGLFVIFGGWSKIATGARDKTARLDYAHNQELFFFFAPSNLVHSNDAPLPSPSNSIWRIKNGVCVARNVLEGHSGNILIVKFSPDSATLATASNDKTVKIWSVVDGALRATLSEHSGWVSSVVFSPNGAQLATGSQDATAKIWDSERGRCVATLKGHSNWINDISFSPDGKAMITGSEDCSARLWSADEHVHGEARRPLRSGASVVTRRSDRHGLGYDISLEGGETRPSSNPESRGGKEESRGRGVSRRRSPPASWVWRRRHRPSIGNRSLIGLRVRVSSE